MKLDLFVNLKYLLVLGILCVTTQHFLRN